MQNTNPLNKYFRQPKIYLSLPSGGNFYPPGMLQGDPSKLPVFGMSAMDEIMFKTPDALFSGEATAEVIKSCIPTITSPMHIPSLDIDSILIAIRMATYGQMLPSSFTCTSCKEKNTFDLDLTKALDYFNNIEYIDSLIVGPLKVNFRPLTYKEITTMSLKIYELRRKLSQSTKGKSEEETTKFVSKTLKEITQVQIKTFLAGISSVETDEDTVEDPKFIEEWLEQSDKEFYDKIKKHLEEQNAIWKIQPQRVQCAECEAENNVEIKLDNSDFFVRG